MSISEKEQTMFIYSLLIDIHYYTMVFVIKILANHRDDSYMGLLMLYQPIKMILS